MAKPTNIKKIVEDERLNPWKNALVDAAVCSWIYSEKNKNNPRQMLADLMREEVIEALDPRISKDARDLEHAAYIRGFSAGRKAAAKPNAHL